MFSEAGSVIHHLGKWLLLLPLVIFALLNIGGHVLLNNVEYFKTDIEQQLAEYGITGVSLNKLEGHWNVFHPKFKIQGASLSIPGRSQALSINELEVSIKLIPSLISGDVKLESLYSSIEKLILVRDREGYWWLNDIPLDPLFSEADSEMDIYVFFQHLPDYVEMNFNEVQIRDVRFDIDYLIQHGSLLSSRENQQLSLKFDARLPEILGSEIQLLFKGDALKQRLYFEVNNLEFPRLLQLSAVENTAVSEARLSLKSWVDLERFHFRQAINEAEVTRLLFNNTVTDQQDLKFSVHQKILSESDNWRVDTVIDSVSKGQNDLPSIITQLLVSKQKAKPSLWIERLDVATLNTIMSDGLVNTDIIKVINGIQPHASLENLVLELDMDNPKQSMMAVDFNGFTSNVYQSIPGINALSGTLMTRQGKARLDIHSNRLSLDFGDLFRLPLEFDSLAANMIIDFNNPGILVDARSFSVSNQDIELEGRFWLNAPTNAKPFISLRAGYENGRVASTSNYLPVSIMPKAVVQWADVALKGGEIIRGDMLLHGRLQSFDEYKKNRSGKFHALVQVKDPEVLFLPDWPTVHEGTGTVSFYNNEINLNFTGVQIAATKADKVSIKIPNMFNARLKVKTEGLTNAKDLLETLAQMPVLNQIDEIQKKTASISGRIQSVINLEIPLTGNNQKDIKIRAKADFENFSISIPDWVVDIKEAEGRLDIEDKSIIATDIRARSFGDPVVVTVHTDDQGDRTNFQIMGDLQASSILQVLPDYLQKPVSGISPWKLMVSVANHPEVQGPLLKIKAQSNMQGSEVAFPAPLYKAAKEKWDLNFSAYLSRSEELDYTLTIENLLKSEGRLQLDDMTENNIRSLTINFDSYKSVGKAQGINLFGHIQRLDFNGWNDYLKTYLSGDNADNNQHLKLFNSVDLDIDVLEWTNQKADNAKLTMTNNGELLTGTINSSSAKGVFKLPYQMGPEQPFVVDLEFFKLLKSTSKKKINPEINDMPNLNISSKMISFEDMVFNDFFLKTRNEGKKFVIQQLDFTRDRVQLKSSGHWDFNAVTGDHVSVFNIAVRGPQFGQAVSKLGLGETIRNGSIDFNGQIGWSGELFNINWPTLIGVVNLDLKDGALKNVEPGAGRFIGLLSLNALPKRLFLDFGDVLQDGMQFDRIKGQFMIAGEKLETNNAFMDSTSAKVKLKGTTNLREKTYDQSMFIIPKVSDTLPIIGGLAAGASVGWGLLLLQQIFKNPIDKSVEIEYKVTGSWEDPVIQQVHKPLPENDDFQQEYAK